MLFVCTGTHNMCEISRSLLWLPYTSAYGEQANLSFPSQHKRIPGVDAAEIMYAESHHSGEGSGE